MATVPTAASPNAPDTGGIVPAVPARNIGTAAVQAARDAVGGATNAATTAATAAVGAVDSLVRDASGNIVRNATRLIDGTVERMDPVRTALSSSNATLGLLDPSKFHDNPLNAYERPTYHLRLLAANQLEFIKEAQDLLDMNAMLAAIDRIETVVLAESGVTAGLIFQELSVTTKASMTGRTRNRIAQGFNITILEPATVSFLDALFEASTTLRNRNFRFEIYYIEVTFMGYRADGSRAVPIEFEQGEVSGRWLYPVNITDFTVNLTAAGSTYDIKAVPAGQMDTESGFLRKAATIQGTTVGAMLNSLAATLNKTILDFYGTDLLTTEFKFRRHQTLDYPNPMDFTVADSDRTRSSIRNRSMVNDVPQAQFAESAGIDSIVQELIGSTEQGHRLLNLPAPDAPSGQPRQTRESVVYRIETEIKSLAFDERHQRYKQIITHHLIPHPTLRPISHTDQPRAAADEATQRAMVQAIQDRGALQKRYDYIHSGLNTEVINLDLTFKMNWYTELTNLNGARRDQTVVETPALYNPLIHAGNAYGTPPVIRQAQQAEQAAPATPVGADRLFIGGTTVDLEAGRVASERMSRLQTEARALAARSGSLTTAERARLAALNNEITRYTSADSLYDMRAYRALQEGAAAPNSAGPSGTLSSGLTGPDPGPVAPKRQPAVVPEASPTPQRPQPSRRLFAEDLIDTGSKIPFSFRQSNDEARQVFGGGLPGGSSNNKSIYGSILDQLYSAANEKLLNITMSVRGDPYWLGASGLSSYAFGTHAEVVAADKINTDRYGTDSARVNVYSNTGLLTGGDQHILLNFRYPTSINETTAKPVIRTSDIYSGIYMVSEVNNVFSNGQFTQELTCQRVPLINIDLVEGSGFAPEPGASSESPSTSQPASPAATTPARDDGMVGPLGVPGLNF